MSSLLLLCYNLMIMNDQMTLCCIVYLNTEKTGPLLLAWHHLNSNFQSYWNLEKYFFAAGALGDSICFGILRSDWLQLSLAALHINRHHVTSKIRLPMPRVKMSRADRNPWLAKMVPGWN
jgi:hypothetical protein